MQRVAFSLFLKLIQHESSCFALTGTEFKLYEAPQLSLEQVQEDWAHLLSSNAAEEPGFEDEVSIAGDGSQLLSTYSVFFFAILPS